MGEHAIKLPDVGEGVAEAELVEWNVKTGDLVREDDILGAVMTDKATVEIPSPVEGKVLWLGADVGDTVSVGTVIVRLEVEGDGNTTSEARIADDDGNVPAGGTGANADRDDGGQSEAPKKAPEKKPETRSAPSTGESRGARPKSGGITPASSSKSSALSRGSGFAPRPEGEKPLASPAVRLRAREAGIDLRRVPGSGPAGRITHDDLDGFFKQGSRTGGGPARIADISVEEIKVTGLRRRISERMTTANAIPHITYVEELDVTALEELRGKLNAGGKADHSKLTILPFLMLALVRAIAEQPHLNAHFDAEAGIIRRHGGVHIGMAAQTGNGLVVPVVRHVEARDLRDCAAEINRLAEAARSGAASREELSGSTITITSLGALGGVVTTPIINAPEVAIVGVNKIATRPMWDGRQFMPRRMMNLSSSFDHRVIDGHDAAVFIQRIRSLIETPTLLFIED